MLTIWSKYFLLTALSFSSIISHRDCSNDEVLSDPEARRQIIADITLATNATKKKATKKKRKARDDEEEQEEECRPVRKAKKEEDAPVVKSEEVVTDDDVASDENQKGEDSASSSTSTPDEQQWVGCDRWVYLLVYKSSHKCSFFTIY